MTEIRTVSLVIPCHDEAPVFPLLRAELTKLMTQLAPGFAAEIVLIDDGSRDATWEHIVRFATEDNRVKGIRLSRNFGHQMALTCGYDLATGDAVVCMDADLQDPPEAVLEMVKRWQGGADIVYGVRAERAGETRFKLLTAAGFYRLMRWMGVTNVRKDSGDFRLLSRRSLEALRQLREQHRFIRGMVGWLGFRSDEVVYSRKARAAGVTKYPLRKMVRLAIDATVSFSIYPLRLTFVFAAALSLLILSYLGYVAIAHFVFGVPLLRGWSSLILSIMAFGALNLVCLGIMGEYVGRIYEQSKKRPLYLIDSTTSGAVTHQGTAVPETSSIKRSSGL